MFTNRGLQAAGLTAILATSAAAQTSNGNAEGRNNAFTDFLRRSSVNIAVEQMRPQGALARNIGLGYGVSGAYLLRLDSQGILSLRADAAAVEYGNERKQTPFSETVGGRVRVNVRTTNYIVPLSVGPQLAWPSGAIRPYVNAGVGAQAFFTVSDVEGTDNFTAFASTTNQSDVAMMWVAGGGIYVPVVPRLTRVQLDVGMQYVFGDRARYLAPGSIVDLPGGQVRISSLESATRLVKLHIGARIGL
jgi:hypothetical protein